MINSLPSLFSSHRDGLLSHSALRPHLLAERVWQSAHHHRAGQEQANAHLHQLLPAVTGGQRLDDGHLLHALHPHPQYPGGLYLWRCYVQGDLLLHG